MKTLTLTFIALLVSSIAYSRDSERATRTPKHGYPMGYVPDSHWPEGAKAFGAASAFRGITALKEVDLSALMTPDDDQGQWGRCTGFGLRRAYNAAEIKQRGKYTLLSANYIYWRERQMEGTLAQDAGAQIKDGVTCLIKFGVCKLWYDDDSASIFRNPSTAAHKEALNHQVVQAYKVNHLAADEIERAMSAGFVVVFGIYLRESFEDLDGRNYFYTGEGKIIGGHCMVFFKYSKITGRITGHNQWGSQWGNRDTFEMPLAMAHTRAVDDCWVLKLVE